MINKEEKIIKEIDNYIIGEFDIKEDNKNIIIINSYEQIKRERPFGEYYKKECENEKEIKENKDKLNNEYLELDDNIINYLESNQNKNPHYLNSKYSTESIYIINYPKDKDIVVSY